MFRPFIHLKKIEFMLFTAAGKIQAFEEELISVSRERDNFQLKYVSAETALEEFKKQKGQIQELNQKLADANNTIALQKHEIVALKVILTKY